MLAGYVSDEYYAALADVLVELRGPQHMQCVHSWPSGAILADVPPGRYEICLHKPGYGSKRVVHELHDNKPAHFRLLSDRLLGYAWPKWCRGGDKVEFRLHTVEPCKLGLWRYGLKKEFIRNLGWYDNHGPRAAMQTLPDGPFEQTGVHWDNGFGQHRQTITAPERSGLYYFHARGESGAFFAFPLVVAPPQGEPGASATGGSRSNPGATPVADAPGSPKIAVLASTNTWNAYNAFGGRSNYIMAAQMLPQPIVNSKSDLPRYKLSDYGEWKSAPEFAPLSFDRPEPYNHVPEDVHCTDPIEGRQACHLAPAEWRLLGWLEQQGYHHDLYADYQLHDGTLDLDRYKVLVLSVHPEYWSADMYRRVKSWVFERGGRLMYLAGNGINCAVEFLDSGKGMRCLNQWPAGNESRFHHRVESEANLLGVVFTDAGVMTVAPYQTLEPDHWVFAGTGLKRGDLFGIKTLHERYGDGASGHETDKISPSSPKNVQLLARGTNPDEGGGHLVYFDTPGGGGVFSAGSITYPTALLTDDAIAKITDNVLRRFLANA